MTFRIGADVGGTFTDIVLLDDRTGRTDNIKELTTYPDPSDGLVAGVKRLLRSVAFQPNQCRGVVHGTTLVPNALISRTGSDVALVCTTGHRDCLDIRRETRYDMYDLALELPLPLVQRDRRFEIRERVLADGSVAESIRESDVDELVKALRTSGAQAVAISLLNSYANPENEQYLEGVLRAALPDVSISSGSELQPVIGEYERTSTVVCNAYVQPLVKGYLETLREALARVARVDCPIHVMVSSGAVCTIASAAAAPVKLVESGPAGGVLAAIHYAREVGVVDLLAIDMGGTTAKACLVEQGRPMVAQECEVARTHRFKRGSGLPIRVPTIDLVEVGAGGGSLARIDVMGALRVGPESASSRPGPACYGRGGTKATVTDADLILGYVNPDNFLGGEMALDVLAAENAIAEIGDLLDLSGEEVAWGIHLRVNESMAQAARVHAAERGRSVETLGILASGGAGPVHAYHLAAMLRSPFLIIPPSAGTASALGFLVAPMAIELAQSRVFDVTKVDADVVAGVFAPLHVEAFEALTQAGVAPTEISMHRQLEMRYRDQGSALLVSLPDDSSDSVSTNFRRGFEEQYELLYGRTNSQAAVEVVTWRLTARGPSPNHRSVAAGKGGSHARDDRRYRRAYFPEAGGFVDTRIIARDELSAGDDVSGPAIIEEPASTFVVGPRGRVKVEANGCLMMLWAQ